MLISIFSRSVPFQGEGEGGGGSASSPARDVIYLNKPPNVGGGGPQGGGGPPSLFNWNRLLGNVFG
jgi:hypothetical protein